MFPTRDDVVAHLERHARESGIELRLGTEVTRIDRQATRWRLETSTGDIDARQVVVANGNQHTPRIPEWPGEFMGEVLHSSAYRNPGPYQGKNVLVVGGGSSGMEIAHDLATGGAAKVWLAVRTPPNIMLRSLPGGLPGDLVSLPLYRAPVRIADAISRAARRKNLGDLSEFGLPIPEEGVFSRVKRLDQVPSLVDMDVIDAIRDGSIEVVVDRRVLRRRQGRPGRRIAAGRGYASFWPPVTGVVWNRSSATSACWTTKGKPVASESAARRGRAAVHRLRHPAVAHRLHGQAVEAHGEADRPRTISRLGTPTPARHREPASDTRRGSCARRCRTACPAAPS